jgi:plastocyanin domain-containing protein
MVAPTSPVRTSLCLRFFAWVGAGATIALLGACSKAPPSGAAADVSGVVEVKADGDGFHPNAVSVKKGEKLSLAFTRTTEQTCATAVVFPDLKVEKDLPLQTRVVVDVPTGDARTLTFQCGMGMYQSKIVVH